jgi:hypothetical protein
MKNSVLRTLSILIFSIGVLAGMALFVSATWADMEGIFYGFFRYGNKATTAMHCPILVSSDETATITTRIKNTTDTTIRPNVRFLASTPGLTEEQATRLLLEPGQHESLELTVDSDNLVLERFIFVKMATFLSYPMNNVEQTCGILVLNLHGITGKQLTIVVVIISLVGMVAGIALWSAANKPLKFRSRDIMRAMLTLTVTVIAGLFSAMFAGWLPGLILTAVGLIMLGVIIGNIATMEKTPAQ